MSSAVLDTFDMESDVEPVEMHLRTGPFRDQAELHGLLRRLQALGLEPIEVRRPPDGGERVRA